MEGVNKIYSAVLEIVEGRVSTKRNQIIKTDTLNTFCEIQAVLNIFHCSFCLLLHAVYYVMLIH